MDDLSTHAVVVEFGFRVVGRTRDECIETADRVANEVLASVGGEPWMMVDDNWQRSLTAPDEQVLSVADDQGFYYRGQRKYVFNGPFLGEVKYPHHDGFKTQKQVEGDQ
jgi:hypothetical protein